MSKINNLIKELCPKGVIYKSLGSFCDIKTGAGVTKKDIVENGKYIIISGGILPMGMCDKTNRKGNTVTIARAGTAGFVNFIKDDFYLNDKCFSVIPKEENIIDNKYLYYSLSNIQNKIYELKSSGTVPTVNTEKVSKIVVPIPPIEIQKEIVRVLDTFGELEVELEAELEARQNQYRFWRGKIISTESNMMKIKDICNTMVGGDVPKNSFSKEKTEDYNIPIYSNGLDLEGLYGYTNIAKIDKKCVTLAGRGAGVGHSFLRTVPFFPIIRLVCLIPKEEYITADYLYHAIQLVKFKIPTTGIPQLTVPMVSEYEIPVPSLEEQERIVSILDKFDRLVNDISVGIPAEIELRRQQYEYYRNKLLSFEELSNE